MVPRRNANPQLHGPRPSAWPFLRAAGRGAQCRNVHAKMGRLPSEHRSPGSGQCKCGTGGGSRGVQLDDLHRVPAAAWVVRGWRRDKTSADRHLLALQQSHCPGKRRRNFFAGAVPASSRRRNGGDHGRQPERNAACTPPTGAPAGDRRKPATAAHRLAQAARRKSRVWAGSFRKGTVVTGPTCGKLSAARVLASRPAGRAQPAVHAARCTLVSQAPAWT